jgi:WD40 repeat protein/transcriptional regulator with XRE-family HTH domain
MSREGPSLPTSLEPERIESRADLAHALTALRARSGLTVRELARRLDTPSATVGDYFSGRHLPGPAQLELFSELLGECGVSAGEVDAWIDALTRVRLGFDGRVARAEAPYRGLEPFQAQDADIFFGREAATEDLIARLRRIRDEPAGIAAPALLLVIGPSGSGKSSLLRAGLAAQAGAGALDTGGTAWTTSLITPGDAPASRLRACIAAASGGPILLVVDQLEEIFAAGAEARGELLVELGRLRPPNTLVVGGLRSDFYEAALREPALLPVLRRSHVLLGPMTELELRRAILEPARRAGVLVEDGLVEVLLADLAPGSASGVAHEAGALPLLSHALLATWKRCRRNRLTIADYRAAGGLRGAISQSAEELYAQLSSSEQDLARRIFCRLVRVQGDAPLTRRTVSRPELEQLDCQHDDGAAATEEVLDRFVAARLITLDAGTIELSHEALLSAWPRLADWLERDRAGLRVHHELIAAASSWIAGGQDESLLLRGARLHAIADWAQEGDRGSELNRGERKFLDAGLALAEQERTTARRRTRRTRQLLAAVAALALAAVALAVIAFHAQSDAQRSRDEALSRQVAIEADDLERTDPALAMQLALAGYRIYPTTQATSSLLDASAAEMPTRLLGTLGPTSEALSSDGAYLAVAYSATARVRLYSLSGSRPKLIASFAAGPASTQIYTVALSPNGRLLAAGGTGKQVVLWSLATPAHPARLASLGGFASTVYDVAFSPAGDELAAADDDGTVRQWSLATPSTPREKRVLVAPGRPSLQALAYDPNGRTLAAVGAAGSLSIWRIGGDGRPVATATATATTTLTSVAYSPDGSTLAAGGQDRLVYLWRLDRNGIPQSRQPPLRGFANWVDSVAFSRDGRYLAAGDSDNSLRIWSTTDWRHVATLDHPAPVTGVAFTPHDRSLITVDEDGTARIWSFPPPTAIRTPGSVFTVDYTASGKQLAAVSGGPGGDVSLWNVAHPWRPTPAGSVSVPGAFGAIAGVEAFSPTGRLLAVGDEDAQVQLVELEQGGRRRLIGGPLRGAAPPIEQLDFNPNAHVLAVGDAAGRIHTWDVADPADPTALPTLDDSGRAGSVLGLVYSSNGRLLAASTAGGEVLLWDVADPRHPRELSVIKRLSGYAYTVAFTPNGRTLIAAGSDDEVRLWDVSHPAHPRALGRPLHGPTSTIYDVAVSPDGRTLAASTTDQDVWLWNISDLADPTPLADLTTASGPVYDVTFSPNASTLAATGADQTLHFWDYHPEQVATRICAAAGTPITRAEWAQYIQGAPYRQPCGR